MNKKSQDTFLDLYDIAWKYYNAVGNPKAPDFTHQEIQEDLKEIIRLCNVIRELPWEGQA